MNSFKRDAFYTEFPFLSEIGGNPEDCEGIKVKRVTEDLLKCTPAQTETIGSLVGIDEGEAIYLISIDGEVLGMVKPDYYFTSNYAHEDPQSRDGETVLEAVARIGKVPFFIVSVVYGYDIVNHYSQDNWTCTIYKAPKDFSIGSLILKAQTQAQIEVLAECEF